MTNGRFSYTRISTTLTDAIFFGRAQQTLTDVSSDFTCCCVAAAQPTGDHNAWHIICCRNAVLAKRDPEELLQWRTELGKNMIFRAQIGDLMPRAAAIR